MKKYNLFKVVGITFLVAVLLTWILPVASYSGGLITDARYPMGIFDIIEYPLYTLGYFATVVTFLLSIGALYGVLDKNKAYKKLVSKLVLLFAKRAKLFLIITIVLLALGSSLVGINLAMFIIIPFLVSIILGLGYDKLTAIASTTGATIIGMFGSIFSSSMYSSVNSYFGVGYTTEIISKIIMLVLGIALLIVFCVLHNRNSFDENKVEERKKELNATASESVRLWPLIVLLVFAAVIIVLGTFDWANVFNTTFFTDLHQKVLSVSIKDFAIFSSILGAIQPFGSWTYDSYAFVLIVTTLLIALCYRIKFNDLLVMIGDGIKKMLIPSVLTVFAYSLIVITVYNPVFLNITDFLVTITDKFNVATASISIMFQSIFNMDIAYFAQNELQYMIGTFADTTLYPLLSIMYVGLFSLMRLIAPTSIILLVSLSYFNVSYTKWIKYIWKLFVSLAVVSIILFTIVLVI